MSHGSGSSLEDRVCRTECLFRFSDRVKRLWQTRHSYGWYGCVAPPTGAGILAAAVAAASGLSSQAYALMGDEVFPMQHCILVYLRVTGIPKDEDVDCQVRDVYKFRGR